MKVEKQSIWEGLQFETCAILKKASNSKTCFDMYLNGDVSESALAGD